MPILPGFLYSDIPCRCFFPTLLNLLSGSLNWKPAHFIGVGLKSFWFFGEIGNIQENLSSLREKCNSSHLLLWIWLLGWKCENGWLVRKTLRRGISHSPMEEALSWMRGTMGNSAMCFSAKRHASWSLQGGVRLFTLYSTCILCMHVRC